MNRKQMQTTYCMERYIFGALGSLFTACNSYEMFLEFGVRINVNIQMRSYTRKIAFPAEMSSLSDMNAC